MGKLDSLSIFNLFLAVGCKDGQRAMSLADHMGQRGIDSELRVSHFVAQICHESNFLRSVSENLNYSEDGLLRTFGRYFTKATVKDYAKKPSKIASRVYANRMGNGDEKSQEGWLYRGRTEIQLTGKANYLKYSLLVFGDDRLLANPDLANSSDISAQIVCHFWIENNCNIFADSDDIRGLTKRINGGFNGLEHRISIYKQVRSILK